MQEKKRREEEEEEEEEGWGGATAINLERQQQRCTKGEEEEEEDFLPLATPMPRRDAVRGTPPLNLLLFPGPIQRTKFANFIAVFSKRNIFIGGGVVVKVSLVDTAGANCKVFVNFVCSRAPASS